MNETKDIATGQVEGKKSFWSKFMTFLAMGGFLVVLVVGVAIAILISYLLK